MTVKKNMLGVGAILALGTPLLLLSCASANQMHAMSSMPEPTAAAVWSYLQSQDYQNHWKYFPGKSAFYKGTPPHGALLTTYVNDLAEDAITNGAATMPPGAVIVKENYTPQKKLVVTTVMYKEKAGYNPEHGDWYWLKRAPDGKVEASGKVPPCEACHMQAKEHDYLMTLRGK
jgi:Cytochrome P460